MNGLIWAVGGGMVLFAAVVSYAMTRRYGWGVALAVPLLALVAMLGMTWQEREPGGAQGIGMLLPTLAFAAPVLAGAVAGIVVARLRRG